LAGEIRQESDTGGRLQFLSEFAGEIGGRLAGHTGMPVERTPHNDAVIRGAFIGLEHESSRVVLTQEVLEGVAFAIRDNLEALRSAGTGIS
ncbi:FGGY-family carbohydrate kinase, partial [Rhizobium ruizarguesonis]